MGRNRKICALVLVGLVAACGGGEDDPAVATDETVVTTTTTTIPSGPAAILVADRNGLVRIEGNVISEVAIVDGTMAVAHGTGAGLLAAEVDGTLVVIDRETGALKPVDAGAPGTVLLYDVTTVDGTQHALFGVRDAAEDRETRGAIWLASLTGEERRELGTGFAPEHHTISGSIGGGLLALSSYDDLTETVAIRPLADGDPNEWSPTVDLEYASPPLVEFAMLAPDGGTVAWLSGPENPGEGAWEIVVADLEGTEIARLPVDAPERPTRLDYDGERLLVSLEGAPPLLIDRTTGARHQLPTLGVATFDR